MHSRDASSNAYVTRHSFFDFQQLKIYGSNTGEYYNDSFIVKLNASGSNLEYSTYLGERYRFWMELQRYLAMHML